MTRRERRPPKRPASTTTSQVDTRDPSRSRRQRWSTQAPEIYEISAANGRRYRRTKSELAKIDAAIFDIAEEEQPVTVRGLFYRVMSRGLVPKSENGYAVVQRQALKLRRAGELPYGWITDGSRLRLKPATWSSGGWEQP